MAFNRKLFLTFIILIGGWFFIMIPLYSKTTQRIILKSRNYNISRLQKFAINNNRHSSNGTNIPFEKNKLDKELNKDVLLLPEIKPSNKTPPRKVPRKPRIILKNVNVDRKFHYKFFIVISSKALHFMRRIKIRATWGNYSKWQNKQQWKLIFVLGVAPNKATIRKVQFEAYTYGDIIVEDFPENFYKLSYKVMIALHWVYTKFKFDFILKCDDDVFVNVDHIMKKLNGEFEHENYIGHVMYQQPVQRIGRYRVSQKRHMNKTFQPYCSGGGFILSHNLTGKIIPLFNWELPLEIDDAYIGELVVKAGIKPLHVPIGFYMWNKKCLYNPKMLVTHPVTLKKCMDELLKRSLHDNEK